MVLEAQRPGQASGDGLLPFVTAGLEVRNLRPTPLTQTSELRARLSAVDESVMLVEVSLWSDGKVRAAGTATWKRCKPP